MRSNDDWGMRSEEEGGFLELGQCLQVVAVRAMICFI